MAHPVGPQDKTSRGPVQQVKKKGCRKNKCSKWKGGKCRCGRD